MAKQRPRSDQGAAISLPPSVAALLGAESDQLLNALAEKSPVSIRLNPLKPAAIPGEIVPWCPQGRYLPERPSFTLDPLFHLGAYYVQEASSMLLEQAFLRTGLHDRDILALDLCAAPGGKSTHLASLLTPGSLLVCNEVAAARQSVLMENLWKHGRANTLVSGGKPSDFAKLEDLFDLVLVDAPCSGEGMFRKDPFARQQWNERLVAACARTQQDILHHAWAALRPGGCLIYSTCTWEPSENEEHMRRMMDMGAGSIPLEIGPGWGVAATEAGYRCYPHRVKGEGFFIALLRKPGTLTDHTTVLSEEPTEPLVASWLRDASRSNIRELEDLLYASPARWAGTVDRLSASVRVLAPGIPIAERKGDRWRPHAALALNELLEPDVFPAIDVDKAAALTFLRGETALPLGSNAHDDKGVRLLRYAGHPLGWMHPAGDRWNNGWPKPWRIRMR